MSSPHGLIPLVPQLLRRQLAAAEPDTLRASTAKVSAAVLIADVSGFTSLAERLTARGPDGVEELSRLVNRWFGSMVDAIESHGGDVIRFAGDAPIALFAADESSGGVRGAVERAAACGQALVDVMRSLRTPDADARVRIGISAGDVTTAITGGVNQRWEFVVGGAPLAQMAAAAHAAQPDEIVFSPQAQAIRDGDSTPSVTASSSVVDQDVFDLRLRPFVPSSVLQFVDAGQSAWTAELRRVTVLFVNIHGVDLDADAGAHQLDAALSAAQRAVFGERGDIVQFLVDDKGLTLVAAWGVPGHRHEDDAVRAVRASVACREALHAAGLSSGGGLATGRVFCGWRGGDSRREYALIGAVVNRAARLMMAAQEGVLMDEPTARAGAAAGAIAEADRLTLKGSAQPVATFKPVSGAGETVSTSSAAATTMVGRQVERDTLARAIAGLLDRTSSSLVIRGDAGMGKSTLVADFLATAQHAGVRVASGTVASPSSTTPYGPWRSILSTVLGLDGISGTADRAAALRTALESRSDIGEYAPLVAEVVGVPLPETDTTSRVVQQARVEKTQDLIVAILQDAAAKAPLAIVLDNLQWADSLSIGLASAAAKRVTPLLLVIATRPLGAEPPPDAADLLAGSTLLDLARLSIDDVRRLICQRLGVARVPDELTQVVETKAAGYPLFVGELVTSLLEAGVIEKKGAACLLVDNGRQLRAHQFPDSVQGAIADRVDRLDAASRLTLKVASAVGARFDSATLASVHPMQPSRADLDRELASLVSRGFLLGDGPAAFEFGHAVIQDVVYSLMPGDQRRPLHRAIAAAFEQTPTVPAATMAHHWMAAGDDARSLHWLERGGIDAARLGAFRETLRHLTGAFAIADAPGAPPVDTMNRVRWLRLAGLAHSELGAMDQSTTRLRTALELLGQRLPASPRAMVARLGRESVTQTALLAGALRARGSMSALEHERALEIAEVLRLLGKLAYYAQDHLRYIAISLQSINVAERAGLRETAGSAYAALGYIVAMLGLERLANRWWRLADESGVFDAQLNRMNGQMLFFNSHVRWEDSLRCADEQEALIARAGTSITLPSYLMFRGYIHLHHGRYAEAEAVVSDLLERNISMHNLQQAFAAHLQLCSVLIEQNRVDAARRQLAEADALASHVADPLFLSIYHGTHVRVHLLAGDVEAAAAPATALRQVIATSSPYFGEMVGYVAMTDYCLRRAETASPAEAKTLLRDARWAHAALKKHASLNRYARPRTSLMEARISAAEGRFARAHKSWRRALALGEQFRMPREIAYAHADLGARSRLPKQERVAHLREAHARFEQMGSPQFAAAAAEALSALKQTTN